MTDNRFSFLTPLTTIFHNDFTIDQFRPIFLKTFRQVFNRYGKKNITVKKTSLIHDALFEQLFVRIDETTFIALLDEIRASLKSAVPLDIFVSNLFYVLFNYYVKSFYGKENGWPHITRLANTVEQLIYFVQIELRSSSHTNHVYTLSQKEVIISRLENARQSRESIKVLNTYCGVPVQNSAKVVHTTETYVLLRVNNLQETASVLQKGIYILGQNIFNYDIYATVRQRIVQEHKLLELSHFEPLYSTIYQRQTVRVQPATLCNVILTHRTKKLEGGVFDISLDGIALKTDGIVEFPEHASVNIAFTESFIGYAMVVDATLVFISKFENDKKYHFKMEMNAKQEKELGKYIAKREKEIIKNLREKSL